MAKGSDKAFDRIMDANFNRAKEGLRVCEDVCRFSFDDRQSTRNYKLVRHELTEIMSALNLAGLTGARNIAGDVGRRSTAAESRRRGVNDIFYANSQRVKESIRVLEEFMKLRNTRRAEALKRLRYKVYALEKNIVERC